MGMTECQGGTDVNANISEARARRGHYEITGHKWFLSAPMSDALLHPKRKVLPLDIGRRDMERAPD
jgi:alkylation response protein AidB-like acyl-CoA dehydrogenase